MIRTVIKDINAESLGWCQCHEHIFIEDGPSRMINEALYMNDYDKSLKEVFRYRKAGGHSFIDAQPYNCGRMTEYLIKVSKETRVNIIGSTGFHKAEFLMNANMFDSMPVEEISELYIDEIEKGMLSLKNERTSGKAGIIKCALIEKGINANELYSKLFEAVAIAAFETKAPVMIHVDKDADVLNAIAYFSGKRIDTNKIMICHLDRAKYDYMYHREVADTGVYLEYDTICRSKYHSNEKEVELISYMLSCGYTDQIMLSLDTTSNRLRSYGGEIGLDYLLATFKKVLLWRMNTNTLDKIMIKNPSDYLNIEN